jgi:hypothetical protein
MELHFDFFTALLTLAAVPENLGLYLLCMSWTAEHNSCTTHLRLISFRVASAENSD